MNEILKHIETWKNSKQNIFECENFDVSITEELGENVKVRYIDIYGNGLAARATLWETGALELQIMDSNSEKVIILKSYETPEVWQLDDKLNWWLSEIATYE